MPTRSGRELCPDPAEQLGRQRRRAPGGRGIPPWQAMLPDNPSYPVSCPASARFSRIRPLLRAGLAGAASCLFQRDGDVRDEQQVVVAEDDLHLGPGRVQAQRPPGLGGDGDRPAAGLHGHEPQASLHALVYTGI